ncbi:LOW QUALITY PROTEIN: optineurin-like [Chlamydotis macqueenii]
MSSKLKSHPAENGEHPKRETEKGTDSMAASALSTYTPEEMVQQMKELITESNELKEAMKLHNQAMKDRYEELSICREKQKEEREFYELKFKEVKQCLLDKCMANEKLQQHLQNLKEREGAEMEGCMAPEKEMRQLISQVQWLQAEKADMLGIISDLQVKLNISAEDSFVEIGMSEGEINRTAKEHQENSGEMTSNVDIYGRSKTADESKNLQSEELIVSQLLYCLRNETQKREELEKELQNHKERLSKLEKETSNCLKSGTQTEQQAEESSEAVGSAVETLSLQACALFKELQEAHEKVEEAELIQKQLQEKCQVLERKSSAAASELEEKQQLIYTIKKLELQVESMQAEVKLEQAKAHGEKTRYSSLQDTNSKLLPELTKTMKAIDEMKLELHRVDKVVVEQLNAKVELAEQAPAAKQLQIDEMKQIIANYLLLTVRGPDGSRPRWYRRGWRISRVTEWRCALQLTLLGRAKLGTVGHPVGGQRGTERVPPTRNDTSTGCLDRCAAATVGSAGVDLATAVDVTLTTSEVQLVDSDQQGPAHSVVRGRGGFGSAGAPNVLLAIDIARGKPEEKVTIKHPNGQSLALSMLIDTGADVTTIPATKWPCNWPLMTQKNLHSQYQQLTSRNLLKGYITDSLQTLELRAVVWAFQQWQDEPLNVVSDSLYVVGTTQRLECAMIKTNSDVRSMSMLALTLIRMPYGPLLKQGKQPNMF